MAQIKQTYKIKASIEQVWDALTNKEIMEKWGAGPDVVMEVREGGKFSLWGGDIFGTNTKIQAPAKLEQDWYGNSEWEKPSKVIFELKFKDGITTIDLQHDGMPAEEVEDFDQGWKDYYLGSIKDLLEKSK